MIGLIWNLCFPLLCERTFERREGQGTAAKQGLAAVPSPLLRSCGWAESSHKWPTYKFPIWKITDHKWKKLILVVDFLFGLRVNRPQINNLYWILTGLSFAVHNFVDGSQHAAYIHTEYLRKGLVAALCIMCMYLANCRWMRSLHPCVFRTVIYKG